MKLKISKNILRCRRKKNMTQEELAAALGVSSQSISYWENGGYPDIELLPNIANFFNISVDELIGNDKISIEEDIKSFHEKYYQLQGKDRLDHSLLYYRKYPNNYTIMSNLAECIVDLGLVDSPEYKRILREICEHIINGCTDVSIRSDAVYYMCQTTDGEEFERWSSMLPIPYSFTYNEIREMHYWKNNYTKNARHLHGRNNLSILLHLTERGINIKDTPEHRAGYFCFLMNIIRACAVKNEIPDGWLSRYAYYHLCYASALFGSCKSDEGFSELSEAVDDYLKSFTLPDSKPLSLGAYSMFNGISCIRRRKEGKFDIFVYEDGTPIDNQTEGYSAHLNVTALLDILNGGEWSSNFFDPWFNTVREDRRFIKEVEKVRAFKDMI